MLTPQRIATLRQLSTTFPEGDWVDSGDGFGSTYDEMGGGFTHGELRELLNAADAVERLTKERDEALRQINCVSMKAFVELKAHADRLSEGRASLRDAIRVLIHEEHIGDYVYSVRERAASDPNFRGNSWDHPRVKAFSDAVTRLEQEIKTT